ncbi:glycosyl transferase family 2 protein [Nitzschia inconspicua]|uniref:Glycosyl transferase family 2 protein n=1 Tax=Nitzschia inconspicua TaxID=303405 RepID=A0A9K3KIG5_9STRA|nr:glycosyl transferase family 2 protein [Nitzschia inconspicua]
MDLPKLSTTRNKIITIAVDVIIPVHNAAATIQEAVESALYQEWPDESISSNNNNNNNHSNSPVGSFRKEVSLSITVCCYDDGSSDNSLNILKRLQMDHSNKVSQTASGSDRTIPSRLLIKSSDNGTARGAGYARNRAIEMNNPPLHHSRRNVETSSSVAADSDSTPSGDNNVKFLCLLDSDDVMHPNRVALQTHFMMTQLSSSETRHNTLLGCTFVRDPPDSTWHYSQWANSLTDERLLLERYREITILQPTWFMSYEVWTRVGGYVEAPSADSNDTVVDILLRRQHEVPIDGNDGDHPRTSSCCLIHPRFDTPSSLRLAEDLRFFHAHLKCRGSTIRMLRTETPLVTYRYFGDSQSQSFRTSRKLLLQLRVLAVAQSVLSRQWKDKKFIIWGAGRDGKDFYKALDPNFQRNVYCFVDVDLKKLNAGFYVTGRDKDTNNNDGETRKIPIVHFSFLIPDTKVRKSVQIAWQRDGGANDAQNGCIDKTHPSKNDTPGKVGPMKKRQKRTNNLDRFQLVDRGLDRRLLQELPVIVCVALYRTNGVLEKNVASIERLEGENLWHFS